MSAQDYHSLVESGYIWEQTTGHPVIVVERNATHAIVTPVTAFGSGEYNDNLAPWKRNSRAFASKKLQFYRSFLGSELPPKAGNSPSLPPLRLKPGQSMPKPATSWVYIGNVYTVPLTALCEFTKTRGTLLEMTEDSLRSLKTQMAAAKCRNYAEARKRMGGTESRVATIVKPGTDAAPKTKPKHTAANVSAPARPASVISSTNKLPATRPATCKFSWAQMVATTKPIASG